MGDMADWIIENGMLEDLNGEACLHDYDRTKSCRCCGASGLQWEFDETRNKYVLVDANCRIHDCPVRPLPPVQESETKKMSSNLPPGVNENDIPGNRPEDLAWDRFHEIVCENCDQYGFDAVDANAIWTIGMRAWLDYIEHEKTRREKEKIEDRLAEEQKKLEP